MREIRLPALIKTWLKSHKDFKGLHTLTSTEHVVVIERKPISKVVPFSTEWYLHSRDSYLLSVGENGVVWNRAAGRTFVKRLNPADPSFFDQLEEILKQRMMQNEN